MSLLLLLDENISQTIAAQVKHHRPALAIESVHTWRGGAFEGRPDRSLLQAAREEGLTLVTYDQKTIPSNDFGTLTRALILLWEQRGDEDWQDRIGFLEKPGR